LNGARGAFAGSAKEILYMPALKSKVASEIVKRLMSLRVRKQPMTAARKSFRKARWVKPAVLLNVKFRGKTGEGLLRHPTFKGVQEDLEADV
jgi:ATP-dependent DNA ligase